ncbi:sodium:solute symporter [Rhodoflexus caldus]|uniref:sodium:solute symporter n=1 Tax=Rhodoflexus caldus TaxID=2891236 RepID=UPI002029E336|nr:sodium:solute symporter [Rhodoflexus caldus]
MSPIDWFVLIFTIGFITAYGIWKTRGSKNTKEYLLSKKMSWGTIGLSIMATQASAITFLSTPGQAFSDGMRFVQFYFGLPLAMVVLCMTAVPLYQRLHVYTAYEFLEKRFDVKTRSLGAFLFLIQRGLAAGLTIYAPALVLSTILGWEIFYVNLILGGIVVLYTVVGGTEAVSITQKQQMFVIFVGLMVALYMVFALMPQEVGVWEAVQVAGKAGKLESIDFSFDWNNRYNIWSGIIGGFFLQLSYFGTDQSQVQRYLGGKSTTESRLGLIFNGFIKIPMQFLILFIGAMVFVFYQFHEPPLYFNQVEAAKVRRSDNGSEFISLEQKYHQVFTQKREQAIALVEALKQGEPQQIDHAKALLDAQNSAARDIRNEALAIIHRQNEAEGKGKSSDTNYVFLTFVINYLPKGLIGLLIALVICASMSSTSSELNALASTTVIDVYKRSVRPNESESHYLKASQWMTIGWGAYAILFAEFASTLSNNLIEAVNILGSLFYGTILGIFLVAFYVKSVKAKAIFQAAILAEMVVLFCWKFTNISYLWFNLIGCAAVILLGLLLQLFHKQHTDGTSFA